MEVSQFKKYAKFYNLLYKDKDYAGESAYVHSLMQDFTQKEASDCNILDLACGTGRHIIELSKYGYKIDGSDIAAGMIEEAKELAGEHNLEINFYNHSFQESYQIDKKYDVVISMFSAMNYLTTFEDQHKSLSNIYNLLEDGGHFIFDFWNGNAVVRDYSPVRVLRKKNNDTEIIRISETELDLLKQDAFVKFTCLLLENNVKTDEFEELHHLHYYFLPEIESLLKLNNFQIKAILPFMVSDRELAPYEWNISIVAQKR